MNLRILICKDNRLEDCADLSSSNLEHLDLEKNKLSDLTKFKEIIKTLKNLKKLNIRDNCFANEELLMKKVIKSCPLLEYYNSEKIESHIVTNDIERKTDFQILKP